MRAGDSAASDVERRTAELVNGQRFGAHRCAYNVDNCIGRTNFVKMNVLEINVVDFGFRRTQGKKDLAGNLLHALAERRGSDDAQDVAERSGKFVDVAWSLRMFLVAVTQLQIRIRVYPERVIPTGTKRSGGICGFAVAMLIRMRVAGLVRVMVLCLLTTSHWPLLTL